MRAAFLSMVLVAVGACSVDGLGLAGRQCPCRAPWVCDAERDLCLLPGDGAISVDNLRAAWTTPNQIRWQWEAQGSPDQFLRYQLTVAESERDLDEGRSVVVFTERDNPELGHFELQRTMDVEQVLFTTSDLHLPDRDYYARLFAFDTAVALSVSNVARGHTTVAPSQEIVLFADEAPPGWQDMGDLVTTAPYRGTHHYEFVSTCSAGCWGNLRLVGMNLDVSAVAAQDYAEHAYLEFALSSTADPTAYWGEAALHYGTCGLSCMWSANGWTVRSDGAYRLLQFPLRVLTNHDTGEYADFSELSRRVDSFRVGGSWVLGAVVRIDEVYIRW